MLQAVTGGHREREDLISPKRMSPSECALESAHNNEQNNKALGFFRHSHCMAVLSHSIGSGTSFCLGAAPQILVRTASKCAPQPKSHQHLPVAAAGPAQAEGRSSHSRRAADPGDWNLANFVSKHERLQSGFGIGSKPGLTQLKVSNNFATHNLEIISHIANTITQKKNRQRMKGAVCENFRKGIVEKNTVTREAASNHHIIAGGYFIEQLAQLRKQLLKIAVQHKDVASADCKKSICKCSADPMGRRAMDRLNPGLGCRDLRQHFRRSISAAVIYENDFMNVLAIVAEHPLDQRANIHFFIATWNDH